MRKLIFSLLLLLCCTPALAQGTAKSKPALIAEIASCFPDQTSGAITPAITRNCLDDVIASFQQFTGVNVQAGTSYTVTGNDYGQLVTFNNANPVAVTLPSPTAANGFYPFNVILSNLGAGLVTVTSASGTINGSSSLTLSQGQSINLIADGANWQTLSYPTSVLTAKQFGAVGNAVHDDTAALQAWINACQNGSRLCYLDQSGTNCYLISAQLNITSPIYIYGDGAATSRICINNATQNVFNITPTTGGNYGTIRDIGSVPFVTRTGGAFINFNPSNPVGQWFFQNLAINSEYNGIVFVGNTSVSNVLGTTIRCSNHCIEGSAFGSTEGLIAQNNIIQAIGNTAVGIYIVNADGVKIWNNEFSSDGALGGVGVQLAFTASCTVCSEVSINGNSFSDNGTAVLYSGTAVGFRGLLVNNNILTNTVGGVSVTGSGLSGLSVVGNVHGSQNGGAAGSAFGVSISGGTNVNNITIASNVWDGVSSGGTAISIPADARVCAVVGNTFRNWSVAHLNVPAPCTGSEIGPISAKAFGAVGDNSTNDTAALQAWINACQAAAPVNAPCYLDQGYYRINSQLSVTGQVNIDGAGANSSIILPTVATINSLVINTPGSSRGSVRNIGFLPTLTKTAGAAINATHADGWTFDNLRIAIDWNGIVFSGLNSVPVIHNVQIICNNHCIESTAHASSGDGYLSDSYLQPSASGAVAFYSKNTDGFKITNLKIIGVAGTTGLQLDFDNVCTACSDFFMSNSSIEGSDNGFLVTGSAVKFSNFTLTGNEIVGNTGYAIRVTGTGLNHVAFTGNVLFGPSGGVLLDTGSNVSDVAIVGNSLYNLSGGTTGDGVKTTAGVTHCSVLGNTFSGFLNDITIASGTCFITMDGAGNTSVGGFVTTNTLSTPTGALAIQTNGNSFPINIQGNATNVSSPLNVTGAISLPSGNGQLAAGVSSTNGALIAGQGSTNDFTLENKSGGAVCQVPTGTTTLACAAKLSASFFTSTGSVPVGNLGGCNTGVTVTGGATAGTWTSTSTCAVANTITLSSMPTAPHGYACDAADPTTSGVVLQQTGNTATSVTFTVRSTGVAANDVLTYKCMAY